MSTKALPPQFVLMARKEMKPNHILGQTTYNAHSRHCGRQRASATSSSPAALFL